MLRRSGILRGTAWFGGRMRLATKWRLYFRNFYFVLEVNWRQCNCNIWFNSLCSFIITGIAMKRSRNSRSPLRLYGMGVKKRGGDANYQKKKRNHAYYSTKESGMLAVGYRFSFLHGMKKGVWIRISSIKVSLVLDWHLVLASISSHSEQIQILWYAVMLIAKFACRANLETTIGSLPESTIAEWGRV